MTDARAVLSLELADDENPHHFAVHLELMKIPQLLFRNTDLRFSEREWLCSLVRGLAQRPIWNCNLDSRVEDCDQSLSKLCKNCNKFEMMVNPHIVVKLGSGCWQHMGCVVLDEGGDPDDEPIPALAPLVKLCGELGVEVQHVS